MRAYVLGIILGLAVIATAVGLAQKPIDAPMVIDAQSPGVWPQYAGLALPTQPKASRWFQGFEVPLPPEKLRGSAVAAAALFADQQTIDVLCGGRDLYVACAEIGGGTVVLPNPCQPRFAGEAFAAVACHEKGHLLGWPAYHGD